MTVMQAPTYRRAEYHGFDAGGSEFVYLVSAGASSKSTPMSVWFWTVLMDRNLPTQRSCANW